jgi:hypothetical protein
LSLKLTFYSEQPISVIIEPGCTTKIGVEARYYLQHLLDTSPEPLASALGGTPFVLKQSIETNLAQWKAASMQPVFVFDGISTGSKLQKSLQDAKNASVNTEAAWTMYSEARPTDAVSAFGSSGKWNIVRIMLELY